MKKILIIDDDSFFPKTLEGFLPKDKYFVITAVDGEDALNVLQKDIPDLIILDIMMPKLDGPSFLKQIKSVKEYSNIPVIVSSNLSSTKKISDMMALGIVGYVIKSEESLASIVQDIQRVIG